MRIMRLVGVLAFCCFVSLFVLSCTKSNEPAASSGGASLFDAEVLRKLPDNAVAFLAFDTQGAPFMRFKQSAWGKAANTSFSQAISKLGSDAASADVEPFVEALSVTNFVSLDPSKPDTVRQGVLFVSAAKSAEQKLDWGIVLLASRGTDLTAKLPELEAIFKRKGMNVNPENVGSTKGFSLLPVGAKKPTYVLATSEQLAIAQSKELLSSMFSGTALGGFDKLRITPQFIKATTSLPSAGQFFVGYADVVPFGKIFEQDIKNVAASQGAVSDADQVKMDKSPVEAIAFSRSMTENLSDALVVAINAKDEAQKKIFAAIEAPQGGKVSDKVPADSAIFIALDGRLLSTIKNTVVEDLLAGQPLPPMIKLVDSVKAFGIAVRNASAASPFPELLLTLQSDNSAEIKAVIKESLTMALASNPAMSGPSWNAKDVNGTSLDYVTTPFGVGAYIGTLKDTLLIGSSEQIVADSVSAANGSTASLGGSTPSLGRAQGLGVAYADFSRLVAMIESVQGSLAMFTGGRPVVDPAQTASMRELGTVVASAKYENNLLKFESSYLAPAGAR